MIIIIIIIIIIVIKCYYLIFSYCSPTCLISIPQYCDFYQFYIDSIESYCSLLAVNSRQDESRI